MQRSTFPGSVKLLEEPGGSWVWCQPMQRIWNTNGRSAGACCHLHYLQHPGTQNANDDTGAMLHADMWVTNLTPPVGHTPEGMSPREDKGVPSAFGRAAAGEHSPLHMQEQPDGASDDGQGSNLGALLQVLLFGNLFEAGRWPITMWQGLSCRRLSMTCVTLCNAGDHGVLARAGGALLLRHILRAGLPVLHLCPLRRRIWSGDCQGAQPIDHACIIALGLHQCEHY